MAYHNCWVTVKHHTVEELDRRGSHPTRSELLVNIVQRRRNVNPY